VAYGVNQVTTATENNSKKIAENNKLIDIYKTKIGELGNAIATTNTTPDVNADFDKAIERSDKYYKKLKQSAAEKSKDDEEYSKLSEQITYLELENKLKIYKKYKKDTSDLELQLAEEDLKKKQKAFEEDKKNLEKAQKQREDIARNNSSSEQNFNELSVSLKSQSLQEQIELFKKYGKDYTQLQSELDFDVVVISNLDAQLPLKNYRFVKWQATTEAKDLSQIDIGLMPLTDEEWTKGKCGFELLQYMAVGIPSVASPVGVNPFILDHEQAGLLANNSDEWKTQLRKLLSDETLRKKLGAFGKQHLQKYFSVQSQREVYAQLFKIN